MALPFPSNAPTLYARRGPDPNPQARRAKIGFAENRLATFRHSSKAWIASGAATLTQQKDMMGHSSIAIGLLYGGTPVEDMRPFHDAIGAKLRVKPLPASTD
jgi:hypothetical protein